MINLINRILFFFFEDTKYNIDYSDDLETFKSYRSGAYDHEKKKKTSIVSLKKDVRNETKVNYGFVSTYFQGVHYPVHDLDSEEKYLEFIKQSDKNYVIFRSSKNNNIHIEYNSGLVIGRRPLSPPPPPRPSSNTKEELENHYWAIIDEPITSVKKYENDFNWNTINDTKYKRYCKDNNRFVLRFTYKNLDRKPILIKRNGENFSKNFKKYIDLFDKLLDGDALEISAIMSKNKEMIDIYNRKVKLTNILK